MWIFIIIMILVFAIFILMSFNLSGDCNIWSCVLLIFTSMLLGLFIALSNSIDPIEVYRGNTTLEITYRDSIPVDSVVVLKNK